MDVLVLEVWGLEGGGRVGEKGGGGDGSGFFGDSFWGFECCVGEEGAGGFAVFWGWEWVGFWGYEGVGRAIAVTMFDVSTGYFI